MTNTFYSLFYIGGLFSQILYMRDHGSGYLEAIFGGLIWPAMAGWHIVRIIGESV